MIGQDWPFRTPNGSAGFFESHYSPLREEEGEAEPRRVVGGLAIIHDITGRKHSEGSVQELSGRLLRLQDEERRRIGRELHDSTAQILTAAGLALVRLERSGSPLNAKGAKALSEDIELARKASQEIRSLSYLMHPPELRTMGLTGALRVSAEGYCKRTGIELEIDIPE